VSSRWSSNDMAMAVTDPDCMSCCCDCQYLRGRGGVSASGRLWLWLLLLLLLSIACSIRSVTDKVLGHGIKLLMVYTVSMCFWAEHHSPSIRQPKGLVCRVQPHGSRLRPEHHEVAAVAVPKVGGGRGVEALRQHGGLLARIKRAFPHLWQAPLLSPVLLRDGHAFEKEQDDNAGACL
jgi:hypothetical protein